MSQEQEDKVEAKGLGSEELRRRMSVIRESNEEDENGDSEKSS